MNIDLSAVTTRIVDAIDIKLVEKFPILESVPFTKRAEIKKAVWDVVFKELNATGKL